MIRMRLVLGIVGGLMSLGSFATMLTVRGPHGEPSVLERVPAFMGLVAARAAAHDAEKAGGEPGDAPDEKPGERPAAPEGSVAVHGGVPSDALGVEVHRGLP